MKPLLLVAASLLVAMPLPSRAAVQTREVTYRHGDLELQGFFAWDDARTGKRPGVLVAHEWWGHEQHARNQAKRLAESGYVGFALDMFGKGKVATHPKDAQAFVAEATKDREALAGRFLAALDTLKADPLVDPERVGAIGYCFGGATVLNMARRGTELDVAVSFHGSLATDAPAAKGAVKARVLVLNGADDPMVTSEQIEAFKKEMTDAGADFRFVNLAGAKHGFTNPAAGTHGIDALAYSATADAKSWKMLLKLLREVWP